MKVRVKEFVEELCDEAEKIPVIEVWYSIGDVARKLGVQPTTIRMYEREGLIAPARSGSGRRVYAQSDIDMLSTIRTLMVSEKISLAGMRKLLALLPCWSISNCGFKEYCVAYNDAEFPCWVLRQREGKSVNQCRVCKVYRQASLIKNLKSVLRVFPIY
jgi:MerR family transcriptional regulator/heat shock protein HspR